MSTDVQGVSLNPETFVEGGGLLDNVVIEIVESRAKMWDYNGKVQDKSPALFWKVKTETGDVVEQYFSAGAANQWTASKDETKFLPVGSQKGFVKSSNIAVLLQSIVDAGFPKDKLTTEVTVFEGCKFHVFREVVKRDGLPGQQEKKKKYDDTVLKVDQIVSLPWDAKEAKGAAGGVGNADLEGKATGLILEILGEKGKVAKKDLAAAVFGKMDKKDADRPKLTALVATDTFLGGENAPWKYADGVLSMG